ncbi:hypothetical protein ACSYDW_18125 [Paeniglutamicibacter sp. R2-26]|uniref:hypothetical protein n=1 Tax=Paeniglutamicibacter sp. R2-26 TaxID=3144417 RepID=UPI003EE4A953
MKQHTRLLAALAMGSAAALCLASCTYLGVEGSPAHSSPATAPSAAAGPAAPGLESAGKDLLADAIDALLAAEKVTVSARGTMDGVPFSYEASGDYDLLGTQHFEMRDGRGHVEWLAAEAGNAYYVKANKWHGDMIEPTDHLDYLDALREDRWLKLPGSEVASMVLVSDEIDDLSDFLEDSSFNEQMKYQGLLELDGVPAHRFSSPEATLWLSDDPSPLPLSLETVGYEPYTRMTSTYTGWNEAVHHEMPAEGDYATVSEFTSRTA